MILVTGGTGLVGSHLLLDLVKTGESVRALYRKSSSFKNVKKVFAYGRSSKEAQELYRCIDWREADINDVPLLEEAFENITTVYHCAALVSFDPSDDRKLRKINIEGTANVVNLCIAHQVRKLCYVSSIATFDLKPGQDKITEESLWNKELNHSMYAISKYGAEMEVWRASQEGVPVVIVNPGVIIGPGSWNSGSGLMFKKVWKGLKFHFPKTTGFVGVKDVSRAMRLLMSSDIRNDQFLLVSENLSFRTVLQKIAKELDRPAPAKELKPWMISFAWLGEMFLGLFGKRRQLSSDSAKSLFNHTYYDNSKVKETLNYEFKSLQKVIEETAAAFKKEFTA